MVLMELGGDYVAIDKVVFVRRHATQPLVSLLYLEGQGDPIEVGLPPAEVADRLRAAARRAQR